MITKKSKYLRQQEVVALARELQQQGLSESEYVCLTVFLTSVVWRNAEVYT